MEPKPWYTSKTIWFNVLAIAVLALELPELTNVIPDAWEPMLAAFVAVVNLVLRSATDRPISLTDQRSASRST